MHFKTRALQGRVAECPDSSLRLRELKVALLPVLYVRVTEVY